MKIYASAEPKKTIAKTIVAFSRMRSTPRLLVKAPPLPPKVAERPADLLCDKMVRMSKMAEPI